MSHTSGIDSSPRERNLKSVPGTKYEYSNYGYIILGYILENVTGRKYDDLASEILRQVGMSDSFLVDSNSFQKMRQKHPNLVPSFLLKNGKRFDTFQTATRKTVMDGKTMRFLNSYGGLISTASDLGKWNRVLHEGKILSPKAYKKKISPISKSDLPEGFYGCGLCASSDGEIYHTGYADSYKTTLSYFSEYKISLAILENISIENNYEKDFKTHKNIRNIIRKYIKLVRRNPWGLPYKDRVRFLLVRRRMDNLSISADLE